MPKNFKIDTTHDLKAIAKRKLFEVFDLHGGKAPQMKKIIDLTVDKFEKLDQITRLAGLKRHGNQLTEVKWIILKQV